MIHQSQNIQAFLKKQWQLAMLCQVLDAHTWGTYPEIHSVKILYSILLILLNPLERL